MGRKDRSLSAVTAASHGPSRREYRQILRKQWRSVRSRVRRMSWVPTRWQNPEGLPTYRWHAALSNTTIDVSANTQSNFLSTLPVEIRLRIYEYVLTSPPPSHHLGPSFTANIDWQETQDQEGEDTSASSAAASSHSEDLVSEAHNDKPESQTKNMLNYATKYPLYCLWRAPGRLISSPTGGVHSCCVENKGCCTHSYRISGASMPPSPETAVSSRSETPTYLNDHFNPPRPYQRSNSVSSILIGGVGNRTSSSHDLAGSFSVASNVFRSALARRRSEISFLNGTSSRARRASERPQPPSPTTGAADDGPSDEAREAAILRARSIPFNDTAANQLALLLTCRQTYRETIDLFYSSPTFVVQEVPVLSDLSRTVLPPRLACIRNLQLHFLLQWPAVQAWWDNPRTRPDNATIWFNAWRVVAQRMPGLRSVVLSIRQFLWEETPNPAAERRVLEPLLMLMQGKKLKRWVLHYRHVRVYDPFGSTYRRPLHGEFEIEGEECTADEAKQFRDLVAMAVTTI